MRILLLSVVITLATAVPATAAEKGVITGRVVNQTTGQPAANARVTLSGADQDGSGRVRRSLQTDDDGRYRFAGLEAGRDWLYVIDAGFDNGVFPGSPFGFPQGERPLLQTTHKVWNTTSDPNSIVLERDAMFVLPSENEVGVVESVKVLNHSTRAYIGRGAGEGAAETTFGFGLPSGAHSVKIEDASLDVPELVETDFGFGITVALPPGESTFTYSYRVPADGATYVLSKTALYPTADFLVFVGEPLDLDSDRLRDAGSETVEGKTYRRWEAPGMVDAGDTLLIQAVAQADIAWLPFGIGAVALLGLVAGAYLFMRRREQRTEPAPSYDRDDLIAAIASLDLEYESGSLEKTRWETERERLKSRLVDLERTG